MGGEGHQPLQRLVHLLRRALKQPSASAGEQGVAAEEFLLLACFQGRQVVGQMGAGVAWHPQHPHLAPEQREDIPVAHAVGLEGNAFAIGLRRDHLAAGPTLEQARGAPDVVAVMVGVQDGHQLQLVGLQPGLHGL